MSTPPQPEKQSKREVASEDISTWLSGPGALFVGGLVIVLIVGFIVSIFL